MAMAMVMMSSRWCNVRIFVTFCCYGDQTIFNIRNKNNRTVLTENMLGHTWQIHYHKRANSLINLVVLHMDQRYMYETASGNAYMPFYLPALYDQVNISLIYMLSTYVLMFNPSPHLICVPSSNLFLIHVMLYVDWGIAGVLSLPWGSLRGNLRGSLDCSNNSLDRSNDRH